MCRLFGLSGGTRRIRATFWLLDAPDSLARQSHREPDGTGLGWFDASGAPHVAKQPVAAYRDASFARDAQELCSTTFLAHLRYATTGEANPGNTHPFVQRGRLFAHNGVVQDLAALEAELGEDRALVAGDTDSERLFALVTRAAERRDGDLGAAIAEAARWVAEHLPVYALNLLLATHDELWALRYPGVHELWVLERAAGGHRGDRRLEAVNAAATVRVHCDELADHPSVVLASERMDDDPGWRLLEPGELLRVGPDLAVTSTIALTAPPSRPLTLSDLAPHAAAAQAPPGAGTAR